MAHLKINTNNNKGLTLTAKSEDDGLFDGFTLKDINEQKTRENLAKTPVVPQDIFVKDLLAENKSNDEKMRAEAAIFSKIPESSEVIGATIQPLITSANVSINGRDFQAFFTNKNNSGGARTSVLKLYESIEKNGEKQLQEVDLEKTRVAFKDVEKSINTIVGIAVNIFNEKGDPKPLSTMCLNLPVKYGKKNEKGEDISNFWSVDKDGRTQANVVYTNIVDFVKIASETANEHKNDLSSAEGYDEAVAILDKFNNNVSENLITMGSRLIQFNDPSVKNVGVEIKSTKIDEAEFVMANKDNSLTITTSTFSKNIKETDIEKFKSDYVSKETRNDIDSFAQKAQSDPYVAYHLMNTINSAIKPHLQEIGKLIKEPNSEKLYSETKAIKEILAPLNQTFPSIGFSGKYYTDKFGNGSEANEIFHFASSFIKTFKNKIVAKLNLDDDYNKITLTKDGSRVKGSANGVSIYYNGSLPMGTGIAEIKKTQDIKGTMSKENVLAHKLEVESFLIPTKNHGETIIPARILFPSNNRTLGKELIEILKTINTMNKDGELRNPNGSTYSANIDKKIDKLLKRANGDGDKKPAELENKIYIKTKGAISDALSLLANAKNSPEELKKVLESPKLDDALKLAAQERLQPNSAFNSFLNSVGRNNQFRINEALRASANNENGEYVFVSDKNIPQDIRKYINKIIGVVYDKDTAYQSTHDEFKDAQENPLFDARNYGPINPAFKKLTGKTSDGIEFLSPDNFKANLKIGSDMSEVVKKDASNGESYEMNIPMPTKVASMLNVLLQNNIPSDMPLHNLKRFFKDEYEGIATERKDEFIEKINNNNNGYIKPSFDVNALLGAAQTKDKEQLEKFVANTPIEDNPDMSADEPQAKKRGRPANKAEEAKIDIVEEASIPAENEMPTVESYDFGEIASNPYDDYIPNMNDNEIDFGEEMGYYPFDEFDQDQDENINNKFKL